jgi:hypothetical protein
VPVTCPSIPVVCYNVVVFKHGESPTRPRDDSEITADYADMQLLRDVATGRVITLKGNYASAIMALPLERLVGQEVQAWLVRLQAEHLVFAPPVGPPSLAPRAHRLLGMTGDQPAAGG